MIKNTLFFLGLYLLLSVFESRACTSIIISGKATPDGRPLMWKHRDTEAPYNHMAYFSGEGYSFLGLVNSDDPNGAVWMGSNETGFSIMNTASFNLKEDDIEEMDQEGMTMRKALCICRTVQDFEHYMDTLSRPMRVEANFGVIDAYGGAAYFEANNERYYKKDVNDTNLAPEGYLIYTNFSFEGRPNEGLGYIRYETATGIFRDMLKEGFTPQRIFQKASRSFYNSLLGIDLKSPEQSPNKTTGWFVEQDFIPRSESTASIVIQGVRPGSNPEMTTMWTALGYPPTAIALPLWVKMGESQPALVTCSKGDASAPLSLYASRLKDNVYSIHRGNGQKYLHWQLLWNEKENGYMQSLEQAENRIFRIFATYNIEGTDNKLNEKEVNAFYQEAIPVIQSAYTGL